MALQQAGLEWVNDGLGRFLSGVGQANRAMQDSGSSAEGMSGKFSFTDNIVVGFARSVGETLWEALVKTTKAAAGLVTESIGLATEFQGMSTRLEIAGKGAATQAGIALDDLSKAAIRVGGDTRLMGVSATGAAEAITDLLKAGLSVNDVMGDFNGYMNEGARLGGVLGASIGLASASELDMVAASNLASVSMTIFGLSAQEVEGAMDYIVRGADASVASVSDIRDALEGAGPVLRGFGFSIEDSVDAISLLSNAGIRGAEAGTALRSAFTHMTSNKAKVIDALAEQGVAITDASGKFLDFKTILGQLTIATENMTQKQKADFLQTIGSSYGKTALTALVNQGTVAYDKYSASVQNAAGIQFQAEQNAKTLGAAQEALKGNLETLQIQIGSAFLPALTGITRGMAEVVDFIGPVMSPILEQAGKGLTKLADKFLEAALGGVSLGELGDKIGGALEDFFWMIDVGIKPLDALKYALTAAFGEETAGKVTGIITQIIEKVDQVKNVFNNVKSWIETNWPKVQAVVETVFEAIGKIIDSVVKTIGPPIQSLVARIKEIDIENVKKGFEVFGNIVKTVAAVIGGILVTALGLVSSAFAGVISFIESVIGSWEQMIEAFRSGDIAGGLLAAFTGLFEGIWEFIKGFATGFITFFSNLLGVDIAGIWKTNWEMLVTIVETVWGNIVTAVTTWWNTLTTSISGWWTDLSTTWQTNWDNLLQIIETVWANIKTAISTWLTNIFLAMGINLEELKTKWSTIWNDLVFIVTTVWQNISTAITEKFLAIKTDIDTRLAEIKTAWDEKWAAIKEKVSEIWDAVVTYVNEKATALKNFIQDEILTPLQTAWATAWEAIKTKVSEIWTGIVNAVTPKVQEIYTAVTEKIGEIQTWITDKVEDFKTAGADLLNGLKEGILGAVGDVITAVTNAIGDIIAAAKGTLQERSPSKVFADIGKNVMAGFAEGITSGIGTTLDTVKDSFGNIASTASMQMTGMQAVPVSGNSVTSISNSRSVVVEVNANYANAQSEASIYYDVVAALSGARI